MTVESEREKALRRLLTDAVEPVEPAPGAQTRLLARARAQRRRNQRPLMVRWGVSAALASLLVILGVVVVSAIQAGNRSSDSSAASSAPGAPSRREAGPERSAPQASPAPAPALPPVQSSGAAAESQNATGTGYGSAGKQLSGLGPDAASVARLSDLDGDGVRDTLTLGAGTLAAQLSRYGLEAVALPPLGPGARVLAVTTLSDAGGHPVAVVFVRLRQVGSTATDTIASVVAGRLTVLRQGSGPVLLTIDARHGYACNQGTLAESGKTAPFVVDGAQLVASALDQGGVATAGKSVGCGF